MDARDNAGAQEQVVFKKLSWKQTLKALGPGVIYVLTALGAGDLVDSSVSGSHYGYALMWALVLATLVRFLIVNIIPMYCKTISRNCTICWSGKIALSAASPMK